MERRVDMILRLNIYFRRSLLPLQSHRRIHAGVDPHHQDDLETINKNKIEHYRNKILYNTILHGEKHSFLKELRRRRQIHFENKRKEAEEAANSISVCATYIRELENPPQKTFDAEIKQYKNKSVFSLPFNKPSSLKADKIDPDKDKSWMKDYTYFDDSKLQEESEELSDDEFWNDGWDTRKPLTDPNSCVSTVPCGGCGSLLHCKDTSIPGFVPSEIFKYRTKVELRSLVCQRCHFLKEYNVALNSNVSPDEYTELLMKIKHEKALVIIMIDLMDFPCSIWPGIMNIIGTKRPVFVVGNKIDMLPQDSRGYLKNIRNSLELSLKESALKNANIKYVGLISAKTGYGIETLITKLHILWESKGDVYLVGCTNVGKSTLFNAMIQSDYCKIQAQEVLQRATVSQWPGTTLNLLKFPILRPVGWRLYMRTKRLKLEQNEIQAERKLREIQLKMTRDPKYAVLEGHVGRTFMNTKNAIDIDVRDPFSYQMQSGFKNTGPYLGINDQYREYINSKWFFDTPGVVHPDQILSILTVDELMLTIPKELIKPRSFFMKAGKTLFLAGLGRVDVLETEYQITLTVFASNHLPITICNTIDADELYASLLGTDAFAVPMGDAERLSKWPKLKCKEVISIVGEGMKSSSADIVLSSSGWVSVTGKEGSECKMLAWTPDARGIYTRMPLLSKAVQLKGKRISRTPAYSTGRLYYNPME